MFITHKSYEDDLGSYNSLIKDGVILLNPVEYPG